jgi:signal transduction histidine kinase
MKLPRFTKISTKVALSFVLIAILQGGLSILTLTLVTTQAMEASLDDQRLKTRRLIENYFIDARKEMVIKSDLLAGQGKFSDLLARGQKTSLGYELSFYLTPLKLDAILVVDRHGRKITAVGNAAVSAVLLKRNPVDVLDKGYSTTISGEGNRIQIWSLHEMPVNGRRGGVLCIAQSLDRSFIGRIEEISGTQMLLALRKTILVNGRLGDNVFIEYSRRVTADPEQGASGRIKSFVYRTTHLPDAPELELVYFIDTSQSTALLSRYLTSTLLILAATIIAAFVTAMFLYRFSFQKPFTSFQDAIRRISSGELSFSFPEGAGDEFADLEREFETMTENLRKLEHELQISSRMAAVGEMVAGVAHQIRNPLAIMKVSAEMIRDSVPANAGAESAVSASAEAAQTRRGKARGANIRPLAEMIVSEIDSLSTVVSQFLDVSKPLSVKVEDVRVRDFLERAVSLLPLAQYPGRELRVEVAGGAERARFDKKLMEQAVCNLIENALAASSPGTAVFVRAERSAAEDGAAGGRGAFRILVEDSGVGMGEEVKAQLFHPFFTTKSEGTGLGLSIVHRIVDEHGGSVEVRSELGSGTRIAIVLPEN